ncbi:MAG: hypothetical protein M1830_002877 [Pleopsidium flavum]|nr:MAG: hypothetical protein M1830_002877 [Pleopsidium flavum]
MAVSATSVTDQLAQLDAARNLVLGDAAFYPQIVQGILPIIGAEARLELRRWGADFLAETFASPTLATQQKEQLSLLVLRSLQELLEIPGEDGGVLKSVVQAAASIYPLVIRHMHLEVSRPPELCEKWEKQSLICGSSFRINTPNDTSAWETMAAIKSNILRRWDTAAAGVRICCIKFVQRVIQTETPGVIMDPRRPDQNETSLALVPRDHPLIPPRNLEAEASGLLDRLLNIFQEDTSDAVLVNATLNCLGILIRTRQSIANKILSAILNFNPLKQANSPMTPKLKVMIKSMERTTKALLMNINKRNPNGPMAGRIQQYLERVNQSSMEIFNEPSRKRGAPSEPTDGLDNAKRARLGAGIPDRPNIPPLPPGPTSFAQLYTLTSDEGLTSFDVQQLPIELVVKITLPVLYRIDHNVLGGIINGIRSRYLYLTETQQATVAGPPPLSANVDEDEDDYEPDFQPTENSEQILNKIDNAPPEDSLQQPEVALGPFALPQPPPLTEEETDQIGKGTLNRVFGMMNVLDEPSLAKRQKPGLNRLAASNYDREAWITVITRLATRASAGLETPSQDSIKSEDTNGTVAARAISLSDSIRETLYVYVIEDFRARIPIAIAWLNEEWYNDQVQLQQRSDNAQDYQELPQHYERWVLKVLDGIVPYLDAKDKVLIRFLSEIPGVSEMVLDRVKGLARDPERVGLVVNALHYLILLRPPVREICVDALEDLWRNYEDAKCLTKKLLAKWRPHILQQETTNGVQPDTNKFSAARPSAQHAQLAAG